MSVGSTDGVLPQGQVALLDELAAVTARTTSKNLLASGSEAADAGLPGEADDADFEAFYGYWRHVTARHRSLEEQQRRRRWEWIEQMQDICDSTCGELDGLLTHLTELDDQRQEVVRMTTALHERCEQMVSDQERLSSTAEAVSERLDLFDRVADVARILDQPNCANNPDFGSVLDQLDGSIGFLEAHYDFCQAQAYLHQFEHLRNRACISVRSALQKSLEKSLAQVESQLREKTREGAVETQAFYSRFRAAALNYKPMMTLLHKRMDIHETYAATLEELEAFYVHLRMRLITSPVTVHLQTILHNDLQMSQLAPATRQASTYILDISHFERQCFEAYFELRHPQEALRTLLETVADIFYKTMRPVVLSCQSMDSLREMADCLQMDILEPYQQANRGDLMPILTVVFRLHKDVQEKLIYRVQTYIRDEIRGYQVKDSDLNYPNILYAVDPTGVVSSCASTADTDEETAKDAVVASPGAFNVGWFPTMQRTLGILAKIYRVLEMSTFQGLAQEAVDLCMTSLRQAARQLSQRALPDRNQVLGPLVQMMDAQLFLIKHLLILREQVAAFECDLVVNERYFDFSNVWEALQLKLPDGLLGILRPKMHLTQVDSKKDIEAELKASCETLITNLTAHITQPLAALNTHISEYLAAPHGDRTKLKEQPFMAMKNLQEIIGAFIVNVQQRVPFAAAHIRLYLSAPSSAGTDGMSKADGGSFGQHLAAQSTPSILFKPVEIRLVDTWGRLEGLLEEQELDATHLAALGFVRPAALREMVSALFNEIMEAPWPHLVEMVSQVPRTAAEDSKGLQVPTPRAAPAVASPVAPAPPPTAMPAPALAAPVTAASVEPPEHECAAPPSVATPAMSAQIPVVEIDATPDLASTREEASPSSTLEVAPPNPPATRGAAPQSSTTEEAPPDPVAEPSVPLEMAQAAAFQPPPPDAPLADLPDDLDDDVPFAVPDLAPAAPTMTSPVTAPVLPRTAVI